MATSTPKHIEGLVSYPVDESRIYAEIEDCSFWFQHRNALIAALAQKWAPGAAFCDVGGGNGVVAAALQAQGRQVTLIEPGRAACACARDVRKITHVHEGTLEDAYIDPHPLLGAFDVVEHIDDSVGFLKTMQDQTTPGGTVIIAVMGALPWRLGLRKSREDGSATDAARIQREHAGGNRQLAELAQRVFRWEIPWILRGRSLPFGSSIIAIAKNPVTA